jgi:hypothetical protein
VRIRFLSGHPAAEERHLSEKNFSRTPEPLPPNLRKSAGSESKGWPLSDHLN